MQMKFIPRSNNKNWSKDIQSGYIELESIGRLGWKKLQWGVMVDGEFVPSDDNSIFGAIDSASKLRRKRNRKKNIAKHISLLF